MILSKTSLRDLAEEVGELIATYTQEPWDSFTGVSPDTVGKTWDLDELLAFLATRTHKPMFADELAFVVDVEELGTTTAFYLL